jgi:hypothetical protein
VTRDGRALLCSLLALAGIASGARADEPDASEDTRDTGSELSATARARVDPGVTAASVSAADARRTPGALGEPARALGDLPGVARGAYGSGELAVWGSPAADTRVYVDGVEIPALFHPGGLRSTLHPALLAELTLIPAAAGPEYGGGLGAVVTTSTRDPVARGARASLGANTLDASAAIEGALGRAGAAWALRAGYGDRLAAALAPRADDVVPVPAYADGMAKVHVALDENAALSALWLGSHDRFTRGVASVDPGSARTELQTRDVQLGYVRYARAFADGARVAFTPFVLTHARGDSARFGGVPWELALRQLRYGVRAEYAAPGDVVGVRVGVDAWAMRSAVARQGTLALPPREGDVAVFGQPPGDAAARDRFSTYDASVAPYAALDVHAGRWSFEPGVRLDVQALNTSRALPAIGRTPAAGASQLHVAPEPRVLIGYAPSGWLALGARAGMTHQAPAPEDRSALFGNPALGPSRVLAVAAGPRIEVAAFRAELSAFYKALDALPARSTDVPPGLARALVQDGSGASYGAELLAGLRPTHGVSAQLAYTLSRATRRDAGGATRLFDLDQTHVVSLIGAYSRWGFTLSGRARFASGNPRTPVIGAYANLRDDRYEPVFGAHNAARLPAFFALDLRLERAFQTPALSASIYLEALNVTDHRNVEDVAYSFDYAAREDVVGLPALAVLGGSIQF